MDAIDLYAYHNKPRATATATSVSSTSNQTPSRPIRIDAPPPDMSTYTIASLKRIDRDALYTLLKQSPAKSLTSSSSTAAPPAPPSSTPADAEAAETAAASSSSGGEPSVAVIDVRDSDFFGGHIRGCTNVPTQALDYKLPELVRQLRGARTVVFHCALSQQRGPSAALRYLRERGRLLGDEGDEGQDVCVLEGGFVRWQEKYGMDETVTEGYKKDIWEYGY